MSLTTTLESPKHWDLGRVVRRTSSPSNEGDNHFSFRRLVGKARRGRASSGSGGNGDPPPPPPKDEPKRSFSPSLYSGTHPSHHAKLSTSSDGSNGSRLHGHDIYLKSPHHLNFTFSEVQIPPHSPPIPMHTPKPGHNLRSTTSPPVSPPNSKFEPFRRPSGPPTKLPTPAERARARIEAEREKEFEACLAVQEEEERQARMKAEKEELRRQEEEEETRRVAKLEQDIRLAQLLRKQREHDQAKADEKFAQEAEERRKANKEKRLQEHYRSEAWRIEQERNKEQSILKREEEKKRGEEAKMQERKRLFNTMKAEQSGRLQLSGWMSVQTAGAVNWRRRWYTFDEKTLKLFKTRNDTSPVDVITLSDIRDVRDCGDVSEEEPGFIPNSFVIEEVHRYCWSIFTDTQDAMEKIMAALIFCSDVHKADPSRRRSNSILSASRIPRLSLGLST